VLTELSAQEVTALLCSAEAGAELAWDRLAPLVYEELRTLAHAQLADEHSSNTLTTTELVHEAYLRLVDSSRVIGNGRSYFFGAAARAMRQILVDHARSRARQKRGGGGTIALTTLDDVHGSVTGPELDLVELDLVLTRLAEIYPRAARVVEYRFFGGLSTEETAVALGIGARTVKADWALARAWLFRELRGRETDGAS
jgi:RNA polymerase sigma-70 factor (ECF subfamily)